MPDLRVGIIGCGRIAQLVHLNILTRLGGAQLVALADSDPQRLEEAHRRVPGARAFARYEEVLELRDVEAVVICLPNSLHAAATVAAVEQGKHVYLEKPLATNVESAQRVIEAWRRARVVGMIGFNYRFNPLHQAAREYLSSGRLGALVGARSVFAAARENLPDWQRTRQNGGGALLDLASHHIDLVFFLFGQEIREVFARIRTQRTDEDSATIQVLLADGLSVQSLFAMKAVEEDRFEIYGQAGKLTVDRYLSTDIEVTEPTLDFSRFRRLWFGLQSSMLNANLWTRLRAPASEPSYQTALSHFVASVRANRCCSPDLWDGYRSLAIVEAAEASAKAGCVVSLPEIEERNCF